MERNVCPDCQKLRIIDRGTGACRSCSWEEEKFFIRTDDGPLYPYEKWLTKHQPGEEAEGGGEYE